MSGNSTKTKCGLCPHGCLIAEGKTGICKARTNINGVIVDTGYGKITSAALDPIEKKPLSLYYPGTYIFSVGSYGCNMRCPFCQNWRIAACTDEVETITCSPKMIVNQAVELKNEGNIGIAYTYNEPLVNYEFVYDCAKLAKQSDLKNVLVSNGMINTGYFKEIVKYMDAANIDLKGFTQEFYTFAGGYLETVKDNIKTAAASLHLELTTLIIPGMNDDEQIMHEQCEWIANINPEIPLHLSRFFPQYKLTDRAATPKSTIYKLKDIAENYLKHVYTGNM